MNPNKPLPPKALIELRSLHSAETAHSPTDELTIAGISTKAYPPYPRTKRAYYEILQTAINKANAAGYEAGREAGKVYILETRANKYADTICKLVDKL